MNLYGDMGNVLALRRRLAWRGYTPSIDYHHPGGVFPKHLPDIIVGGGGQDSGQKMIHRDLLKNRNILVRSANEGVPMLVVCGLYQLFGNRFVTASGDEMEGIGVFDAETIAKGRRLAGNIIVSTPFGKLVGYENHSGRTILSSSQKPLGSVVLGHGNAENSESEGAVYQNVYGTYLHGAVLPRNPIFADKLLEVAILRQ